MLVSVKKIDNSLKRNLKFYQANRKNSRQAEAVGEQRQQAHSQREKQRARESLSTESGES